MASSLLTLQLSQGQYLKTREKKTTYLFSDGCLVNLVKEMMHWNERHLLFEGLVVNLYGNGEPGSLLGLMNLDKAFDFQHSLGVYGAYTPTFST